MAAVAASAVSSDVLNTLLYFSGPFFCNPGKPLLQALWCRTGYDVAYQHFKRDHTKPFNLAMHALALSFQLTSNFALLHRLDELVFGPGKTWLAGSTALLWALLLAPQSSAPRRARLLALAAIAAGFAVRKHVARRWELLTWANGVVEAMAFKVFIAPNLPAKIRGAAQQFPGLLAVRWGWQALLLRFVPRGATQEWLSTHRVALLSVLFPALLAASYKPFQRRTVAGSLATIFQYSYLGWLLSLLSGEKAFFLHSCAFTNSVLQGVAHDLSKELPTLPQLADAHYELAHCTYFPVLAVHRVVEHLGARAWVAARAAGKA